MKQTKNDKGIQVRRRIKAVVFGAIHFGRHFFRFVQNVNANYYKSENNFLSIFISNYHVIEKSLTMPNFELGHARERVFVVCNDAVKYKELGFDLTNIQYQSALQAIDEYRRVHTNAGYDLGAELTQAIDKALASSAFTPHNQPEVRVDDFFSSANIDFASFARSRHSVRTFSDEKVPLELIDECVDIARTTPTACNRQPNKAYIITDKNQIQRIIEVQGGGRGFAEKSSALIIVTGCVSCFGHNEILEVFKSGGMYSMNLLYALHSKHIVACTLEWNERKKEDIWLRNLISIPNEEEVIMIIAIGFPPKKFKYVLSQRNSLNQSIVHC